jgi:hypothetical protein
MSSLQQNWRKGQNRFCLEERGVGRKERRQEAGWRDGPNNVCTYEQRINKPKIKRKKTKQN